MTAINPWKQWYGSFVPNWLLSRKEIGATEKLLYASLCRHHGRTGNGPYPSVETLAKEVGASRRTVFRAIGALRDVGLIEVIDRRPHPARYVFLDHEWMHESANYAHADRPNRAETEQDPDEGCDKSCTPPEVDHADEPTRRRRSRKSADLQPTCVKNGAPQEAPVVQDPAQHCAKSVTNTLYKDPPKRGGSGSRSLSHPYLDAALERRLGAMQEDQAAHVLEVLGAYDRAFVGVRSQHYVWSDPDLGAAAEAWDRAQAIAVREAPDAESVDEYRGRVLAHWCSRLAHQEGWVQEKRHQFWTFKHVVSALGLPFRAELKKAPRVEQHAPPAENPQEMWAMMRQQLSATPNVPYVGLPPNRGGQTTKTVA